MLEVIHTQLPYLFLFFKCVFGDALHILWVPLHRKKEPNLCSIFLVLLTSQNTYVLWHSSTKPIFQAFIHRIVAFKCHAFQEDMYMWRRTLESNPQLSDCHTATLLTLPSIAPRFLLFCRLGLRKLVCVCRISMGWLVIYEWPEAASISSLCVYKQSVLLKRQQFSIQFGKGCRQLQSLFRAQRPGCLRTQSLLTRCDSSCPHKTFIPSCAQ